MAKQKSALVYFGTGLDPETWHDRAKREQTLSDGVASIVANVEGLRIVSQNRLACTSAVTGSAQVLGELQMYLATTGLGSLEFNAEKASVRAAIKEKSGI